ncbi:polysaccharide pyruvyl transferase family protein [Oscillospiraceae bacterium MB08-C2-2]|nr:polysaccharide pyruvyl transferase family protein [Oscillospiraceae bacterium MB08-C2-2]
MKNIKLLSYSGLDDQTDWSVHEARILEMSEFIDEEDTSVIDMFARHMYLQKLLSPHIIYYPVDFIQRCSETLVCDFNKKEFPHISADIAFLAGVLEYIQDMEWFLTHVTSCAKKIILSYHDQEAFPSVNFRRGYGWINDFTIDQIIATLHAKGFMLTKKNIRPCTPAILCFIQATPEHLNKNYLCSGCAACANICPVDALVLEPDEDGFFRPQISLQKCISCNKCVQVCPVLHPLYSNTSAPSCYAYCADDHTRFHSSSGGVFPLLAHRILDKGGIACGVAWKKDFGVQHILIDNLEELPTLLRSKYLQSEVRLVYRQIQNNLEAGLPVLFSGCPCQVAALNAYLGKPYELLYTIDLLCHYSPSSKHFQQYLDDTFGKQNIASCTFRTKELGWNCNAHNVTFKDNTEQNRLFDQDFYQQSFHGRLLMNDACEICRFSSFPRQGDITIGDFHGIGGYDPALNDGKGTSVILVNNSKGKYLLQMLQENNTICKEVPLEWIMNNRVNNQFPVHPARDRLYALAKYLPFNKAAEYAIKPRYDVGIVGVWSVENYGSNMTYYALYRIIRDMGLEPLMIERPLDSEWKPHPTPTGFKHNPYRPFDLAPLYANSGELQQLNNECDLFLVGSDQLLNGHLYLQFGQYITLNWVEDRKKKIAYATSFGADRFVQRDDIRAEIAYFLKKFDCLSFRDSPSMDFAKSQMEVDADLVLDPVFLCDKKHFNDLAAKGKAPDKKYVAAYILDPDVDKKAILASIEECLQLKSNIHTDIAYKHDAIGQIWGISSSEDTFNEDWLRSIVQSEFVVTDSFHGMCFAIIYRKPFLAIPNEGRGTARFTSLLETLGLQDRLISHLDQLQERLSHLLDIDYDRVFLLLEKEVEKSRTWLEKALVPVMGKSKSTYDFLKDYAQIFGERFAGVDEFTSNVHQRLQQNDEFVNNAHQHFRLNDETLSNVHQRIQQNNEFAKHIADKISLIETACAQTTMDISVYTAKQQLIEQRIAMLENELLYIYGSKSYFIGRCIAFLPGKFVAILQKIYKKLKR